MVSIPRIKRMRGIAYSIISAYILVGTTIHVIPGIIAPVVTSAFSITRIPQVNGIGSFYVMCVSHEVVAIDTVIITRTEADATILVIKKSISRYSVKV
jgi:hypothetical protein